MKRKSVFITGGTSGLGLALAKYYDSIGHKVAVFGRSSFQQNQDTNIFFYQGDVKNREHIKKAVSDFACPSIDLCFAFANSGLSQDPQIIVETNIVGTLNLFEVVKDYMIKAQSGSLIGLSTISSYFSDSPYAHSKSIVSSLCSAYKKTLKKDNIDIHLVIPGYIKTEKLQQQMILDHRKRHFIIDQNSAVKYIIKMLENKNDRCIFPWQMALIAKTLSYLPRRTYNK